MVISAQSYEKKKTREAERSLENSRKGRDIFPLPACVNPERKASCERNFRLFCETYFPEWFCMAWSTDHLEVIAMIESAVLEGKLFAVAMPRSSGKSTLCDAAILWAALYGHRCYIVLIGATLEAAQESLEGIKTTLEENERLSEDFSEVCVPIQKIEGRASKCLGQLYQGERTYIQWSKNKIILPRIPGSKASCAIIRVTGLTGRIRGMKTTRPDTNTIVRPDLVIPDDPQTDESANSDTQCRTRLRLMGGAVLGLAGHKKKIAGIVPCTVIRKGDAMDQLLDRKLYPQYNGIRKQLLRAFPTNTNLWDEYWKIRCESMRMGNSGLEATEFYKNNRAEMDAGADPHWPERFNDDEISALQYAMNLFYTDRHVFFAEYQNDPLKEDSLSDLDWYLSVDAIAQKTNGLARRIVPLWASHLTAFIDLQQKLLYPVITAFGAGFTGALIDYGSYPDQESNYFTLRDVTKKTLQKLKPGQDVNTAIYSGLNELLDILMQRDFRREDGTSMRISLCGIDTGWNDDLVYQVYRNSPYRANLMPTKGFGLTADKKPISEYDRKPGETVGQHWKIAVVQKQAAKCLQFDTNFWKTHVHQRLATDIGRPTNGSLSLFGDKKTDHRMIAEHLHAEYPTKTEGRGRTVYVFTHRPNKPDNHLGDGVVGCAALASTLGITLEVGGQAATKQRKRYTQADLRRRSA